MSHYREVAHRLFVVARRVVEEELPHPPNYRHIIPAGSRQARPGPELLLGIPLIGELLIAISVGVESAAYRAR